MVRRVFHDIDRQRGKAAVEVTHEFLVEGRSLSDSSAIMSRFLESYELVRYGAFAVDKGLSLPGTAADFGPRLDRGVAENRRRIRSFIGELDADGIRGLEDLMTMTEGYQSKTVHTIAHLLDGFFGIDSHFFNLVESSHWLSDDLKKKIAVSPDRYMLLFVRASIWPPE